MTEANQKVLCKRAGVRKINEQDETVLLETEAVKEHVKDHANKEPLKKNMKKIANSRKTVIIRAFPFVLFFISFCILILYIVVIRV